MKKFRVISCESGYGGIMKKIVLFTVRWATGGIENVIMNIIRKLSSEEYKFEILVSQKLSDIYDKELEQYNCKINIINKTTKRIFPIKRLLLDTYGIRKFMRERKDYILHINLYNFYGLIYANFVKKELVKKIIVHAHSSGIDNDFFKIKTFINKCMVKILDKKYFFHVSCSDLASNFCFSKKVDNIYFLPNAIDMKKFYFDEQIRKTVRKKENWENKFVIGHIGRFVEQKNHKFLIDVFEEIAKVKKDSILVLIGEGKLKEKIQEKIQTLNLEDKVFIFNPRNDVCELYQGFDMFVLPSLYEGLPVVGVEAQTADLPCVFSDVITKQVQFTSKVDFIPLNSGKVFWKNYIIEKNDFEQRKNYENSLKDSKFNILNFEKNIKSIYE